MHSDLTMEQYEEVGNLTWHVAASGSASYRPPEKPSEPPGCHVIGIPGDKVEVLLMEA